MKIDHVTAIVANADEAVRVLTRLLGVAPSEVSLPGMDIRTSSLEGGELHLNVPTGPGPVAEHLTRRGPGLHHVALRVDDLDATVRDLRSSGFALRGDPVAVAPGVREVFLDPEATGGVLIQLVERRGAVAVGELAPGALDGGAVAALAESGGRAGIRSEHWIEVGAIGPIHVVETRPRDATREPDATVVLLPGPVARGSVFLIDVDGYDAGELLAARGVASLAFDLPGTGESGRLRNGREATFRAQVDAIATALRALRRDRVSSGFCVLGESWGGALATQLAADPRLVRACAVVSTLFRTPTEMAASTFLADGWRAALHAVPDGYLRVDERLLGGLLTRSPEAVRRWVLEHQPGDVAVAPLLAVFDLPYFDPSVARAPGLVIHGELEPSQPLSDARALAAQYGAAGASFVELRGAGHIPRIEHAEVRDRFWEEVLTFFGVA